MLRIFPDFIKPIHKIGYQGEKEELNGIKLLHLVDVIKVQKIKHIAGGEHGNGEEKRTPVAEAVAQRDHSICFILLVLVDLRERVGSCDLERAGQQNKDRRLIRLHQLPCNTDNRHVVGKGSLENNHRKKTGNSMFFEPDPGRAIGFGGEDVNEEAKRKAIINEHRAEAKGQQIHHYGNIEQGFGWLGRALNTTNAACILINIAVVSVTGGIYQQVNDEKGNEGMVQINLRHLAERQKEYRHQKKGERNSQQLDRVFQLRHKRQM